jgi:hypothetical protein
MMRMSPQPDTGKVLACSRLDYSLESPCPIVVFLIVTNHERWRVGGFLE